MTIATDTTVLRTALHDRVAEFRTLLERKAPRALYLPYLRKSAPYPL